MSRSVVFSPHLDDGPLSASQRLTQPDTLMVTVFAGGPPTGLDLTRWGRLTGASSMQERHEERLAEDDRALQILGCATERLDEPEEEFRTGELDLERLSARLAPLIDGAAQVWAPSAVGGNRDHRAARDAVLGACRLIGRDAGIFLFADVPYSIHFGWPGWVTGAPPQQHLDVGFWLESELSACGLDPQRLDPKVFELSASARERKAQAVLAYRSQLPALDLSPEDPQRWTAALSHEVVWHLRP